MDLMMIALAFTRRGVLSICVDVITAHLVLNTNVIQA